MRPQRRPAEVLHAAPKFKPAREHLPVIHTAACPTCGAAIGEWCRKIDGSEGPTHHRDRRRLAIRALRESETNKTPAVAPVLVPRPVERPQV